jgi:hypothetical protein
MNCIITLIIVIVVLFFIWGLKKETEKFGQYLWMPTRDTRLMNYDIRGDPFAYRVFPPYYAYNSPFATYLFGGYRYDIDGRYYVQKPVDRINDTKRFYFKQSSYYPDKYIYKTRKN